MAYCGKFGISDKTKCTYCSYGKDEQCPDRYDGPPIWEIALLVTWVLLVIIVMIWYFTAGG